jgi:photosystem II stability/assembly factor-like uncharacterized protein
MKWFISVILFCAFIFLSCTEPAEIGNSKWDIVYQFNKGLYNSIYFTSSSTGWVVGDSGRIYQTKNGGWEWESQTSNVMTDLSIVRFTDQMNGWAAGKNATILHTTNGGKVWLPQNVPVANSRSILSLTFIDELVGWASTNYGEILRTTDGGSHWITQFNDIIWAITGIYSYSELICWAIATNNIILKTINGGSTWLQQEIDCDFCAIFNDINFADNKLGWVATVNCSQSLANTGCPIYKTTNGGITWKQLTILPTSFTHSIFFSDEDFGWASGMHQIFHSTDGGNSWDVQYEGSSNLIVKKIIFINRSNGWGISWNGTVLRYTEK